MQPFRDAPLRSKLRGIIMTTSTASLLLAGAALVTYDLLSFRRSLVSELETLAQVIGANSAAALLFKDPTAAQSTLAALAAEEHLLASAIYRTGSDSPALFARGPGGGHVPGAPERRRGHRFAGDHVVLFAPIDFDGDEIGTVYLAFDLGEMRERMRDYAGIATLVLVASSLLALALSARLQRVISDPILDLVRTAQAISQRKDFSVRAVKRSADELGLLVDAFNEMLARLADRDAALTRSLGSLERARGSLIERAREVERINAELARSNRDLQDFASVASHDLQEPLRKISAFGDRLKLRDGQALSAEGCDYLQRMEDAAARMQALIDDLLAYSRVATRGQPFVEVDLGELAREALSDLELAIERSGARVEMGPLPKVEADPVQMRQLFQNLLSNALKFRHPGEAPLIRVRGEVVAAEMAPGEPAPPPSCRVEVADGGIGFDEKYLDRLFKPFQRLHGRHAYEGTGIGLAICKRIAERHGGTISARSAPGAGSTFIVELPVRREKEREAS